MLWIWHFSCHWKKSEIKIHTLLRKFLEGEPNDIPADNFNPRPQTWGDVVNSPKSGTPFWNEFQINNLKPTYHHLVNNTRSHLSVLDLTIISNPRLGRMWDTLMVNISNSRHSPILISTTSITQRSGSVIAHSLLKTSLMESNLQNITLPIEINSIVSCLQYGSHFSN